MCTRSMRCGLRVALDQIELLTLAKKWRASKPDQRAFWDSYIEMLEEYARRVNE